MFVVRDILYCKPGKVRPMVNKFLTMRTLSEKLGWGTMRVMTDFCAEQYWTVVVEVEVPTLEMWDEAMRKSSEMKEFQDLMKDYHDLVDSGRREIFRIEGA